MRLIPLRSSSNSTAALAGTLDTHALSRYVSSPSSGRAGRRSVTMIPAPPSAKLDGFRNAIVGATPCAELGVGTFESVVETNSTHTNAALRRNSRARARPTKVVLTCHPLLDVSVLSHGVTR